MLETAENGYGSSTVAKALSILDLIAREKRPMSAAELAQSLEVNGSSIYRHLAALIRADYLVQERGSTKYFLGHKILALSSVLLDSLDIRQIARPLMVELMKKTGEAVHLMALSGHAGIYIERVESPQPIQMISSVGRKEVLHASSVGKAILANLTPERIAEIIAASGLPQFTANTITDPVHLREHLRDVRARGYAIDDMEGEDGVRCIGAAIFDHKGQASYGISIAGPAYRLSNNRLLDFAPDLLAATARISELLGYTPRIPERVNRTQVSRP